MRVVVVGGGPVGTASAAFLARRGHVVVLVERDEVRRGLLAEGIIPFLDPHLASAWSDLLKAHALTVTATLLPEHQPDQVWVAVGTPSLADGSADLSQVKSVLEALKAVGSGVCVMRSTVPPGTGTRLAASLNLEGWSYVAHPEFLRESTALDDLEHPDRIVIGGTDHAAIASVADLYRDHDVPVLTMDISTAELVKVAANAFLATKISFINEVALLADRVGADVRRAAIAIGLDPRIGPHFLQAGIGYGGSCFPKDTRALHSLGDSLDLPLTLMRAVIGVNQRLPRVLVERVREALDGSLQGRAVAVWGLSFKPGSDDLRESPALAIVQLLIEQGAEVRVHDPVVGTLPWGEAVRRCATPQEAALGAHALILATAWPEYGQIPPAALLAGMRDRPVVADGRGALDEDEWTHAGVRLLSIGRSAGGAMEETADGRRG